MSLFDAISKLSADWIQARTARKARIGAVCKIVMVACPTIAAACPDGQVEKTYLGATMCCAVAAASESCVTPPPSPSGCSSSTPGSQFFRYQRETFRVPCTGSDCSGPIETSGNSLWWVTDQYQCIRICSVLGDPIYVWHLASHTVNRTDASCSHQTSPCDECGNTASLPFMTYTSSEHTTSVPPPADCPQRPTPSQGSAKTTILPQSFSKHPETVGTPDLSSAIQDDIEQFLVVEQESQALQSLEYFVDQNRGTIAYPDFKHRSINFVGPSCQPNS